MESTQDEITFLDPPKIDPGKLTYVQNPRDIYVNLFEVSIKKELKLNQYPFSIVPEVEAGDTRVRQRIFKGCVKKLKAIYDECFISGDSLYGINKVDESKTVTSKVYINGLVEYQITLQKSTNTKTIKQEDIHKDELSKQFIEILIKDILRCHPNLTFYKNLFVRKDQKKTIESERTSVNFYPGFTTSFMETQGGNYLNVTLKNKILSKETILEYLEKEEYTKRANQGRIAEKLKERSFKVSYSKNNLVIDKVIFDRNPLTQTFLYEGKTTNLVDYYKTAHSITIKNTKQPLIGVKRKGAQEDKDIWLYYIPELCNFAGLDDNATKDGKFMKQLANYTKLLPSDRVKKTNEFLDLFNSTDKLEGKLSPKEKAEVYGIEIKPLNKLFRGHYMKETKLIGGRNKEIKLTSKVFEVFEKKDMTKWLCLYDKRNFNDADYLNKTLQKAATGYGLAIDEPEWLEMPPGARGADWVASAEDYLRDNPRAYSFVVYLLDKNDYIYTDIKKHSLVNNGYVSQVIKTRSLGKNAMSVCSKILLQINAKLRGASYKVKIDEDVKKMNTMIVGVDSSHIQGHRTGVAMVASVNENFTDFYNKEQIIEEKNKDKLCFCVGSFIEESITKGYAAKNKGELPKNIIIYRQGVSLQQKEYLKNEILQVQKVCKEKNIQYYYILVNTKTTYKFFEKTGANYNNPGAGLLMMEGVSNKKFFEFYIQPQEVTGGSATPTCFHVAHGNMDFPEVIPKLTFDLCHIYSNWQGAVRVPNVIKAAEKLSKMTAKYTLGELNGNLKFGQAYL